MGFAQRPPGDGSEPWRADAERRRELSATTGRVTFAGKATASPIRPARAADSNRGDGGAGDHRPLNDAPVAVSDGLQDERGPRRSRWRRAGPVLGNDTDVDGDALTAVLVGGPRPTVRSR